MLRLDIFHNESHLQSFETVHETVTIGRGDWNTLVLNHPSVSRNHARIAQRDSRWEIADLGSKNGLIIGGELVESSQIGVGDDVLVGEFRLRVLPPADEVASPGTPPPAPIEPVSEDSYRTLESLFLLSARFPAMVDTNQLLEHMLDCLLEIFHAERGQILLLDPKSGELQPAISRKIDSDAREHVISRTLAHQALARGVPVLTTDALSEDEYRAIQSIQREQIRSVVCAPLARRTKVEHRAPPPVRSTPAPGLGETLDESAVPSRPLGVLYLDSRIAQKVFTSRELELLDTFAGHAAEAIQAARERDRLKRKVRTLQAAQLHQSLREHNFQNIIAADPKMVEVLLQVADVAAEDTTTLILGESGTGKELIAKAIHFGSRRKDGPFVAVNCMALSADVIESELFGHEKGAFTGAADRRAGRFEMADGGTLFLDEIGELSLNIQVKLLRVLQERQIERVGSSRPFDVDVRVVAATNIDIKSAIKQGKFREDLYYRLNVFTINIPPLRQRMEDVGHLVDYFIQSFNAGRARKLEGIEPDALAVLKSYAWPGNIRELRNVIERAFVVEKSPRITTASLPHDIGQARGQGFSSADLGVDNYPPDFHLAKELFERNFILKYLRAQGGNIAATAQRIGLPRKTIYRKLEAFQIPRDQFTDDGGADED